MLSEEFSNIPIKPVKTFGIKFFWTENVKSDQMIFFAKAAIREKDGMSLDLETGVSRSPDMDNLWVCVFFKLKTLNQLFWVQTYQGLAFFQIKSNKGRFQLSRVFHSNFQYAIFRFDC